MNQAYRVLCRDLPDRRTDRSAFPTDARRVSAWVEALPRANQAQTQRQLLEAMQAVNGMRLKRAQRLVLLEQLRPTLLETIRTLARNTATASFPLVPAKALAMDQLCALEHALALGYRLAVIELCATAGRIPWLRRGSVSKAIERATWHQSRSLVHAYSQYQTPPAGAWASLHALYRFACAHNLQDAKVDDTAGPGELTARGLYVQALLLALSNPYRFNQGEQAELWDLLRMLAGQVKPQAARPAEDAFAIPVDRDEGPGYIAEERADDRGDLLWLDLSTLRNALGTPAISSGSGPVRAKIGMQTVESSAELLRRLHSGLGSAASRHYQRLQAGHRLLSVVGLAGVHFHFADSVDFDAFMSRTSLEVAPSARERQEWARSGAGSAQVPVFVAEVLDQSLGGYRVRWTGEHQIKARVGELIALAVDNQEEARQWMLGVVRWLRYAADGSVDGGIKLLARRARAVAVRSLDVPTEQRPCMRGIQFEALRNAVDGELHLVVPGVIETISGNLEVVRATDLSDGAVDEPLIERCHDMRVIENAVDYLIIAVQTERELV